MKNFETKWKKNHVKTLKIGLKKTYSVINRRNLRVNV